MDVAEPVSPVEVPKTGAGPADRHGLLKHSREFLDFFWDIAKPQQETRLEATEKLLEYLRARPKVWWRGLGQESAGLGGRKLRRSRQKYGGGPQDSGLGSWSREPGGRGECAPKREDGRVPDASFPWCTWGCAWFLRDRPR